MEPFILGRKWLYNLKFCYYNTKVNESFLAVNGDGGVWRSLVARTLGVGEVARSNRVTPIMKKTSLLDVFFS
jgi:hypothetical protein